MAFRRLLVRLEASDPGQWVVKGGVALLLRLDPNRTSDDIDLAYVHAAGEHAIAIKALEQEFAVKLEDHDFFSFELASPPRRDDAAEDETFQVRVRVRIGETPWLEFGVDLARPAVDVPSEALVPQTALTGLDAVDDLPPLLALTLSAQIAQKVCAMFELHGEQRNLSTRARDLIDIAMIAMQVAGISARELVGYLESEEERRLARGTLIGPLPGTFVLPQEQERAWLRTWVKATRGAAISFDEAMSIARTFLDPILSREAEGNWNSQTRSWQPPPG